MNVVTRLLPAICICVVTQAFAGPEPAEQSPPAAQEPASAATPAAATATESSAPNAVKTTSTSTAATPAATQTTPPATMKDSSGKVVLVDKTLTDAQVKQLLSQGYKPQASGDQVVYCRREAALGSRFETKICRTGEQIGLLRSDSKEMTEFMQRTGGVPAGK